MKKENQNPPKNKFVTDSGLDYNETTKEWNVNAHIEIDLPEDETSLGYGRSITPAAFRRMVGNKLIALKKAFLKSGPDQSPDALKQYLNDQRCAVEFGKESILRVLSQKDCTGLRFTFCHNDIGEESIIVSGLMEEEVEETINGTLQRRKRTCMVRKDVYRRQQPSQKTNVPMPFDDEKGVGKSYYEFVRESGITLKELMQEDEEQIRFKFTAQVFGLKD